jgi:hypothetical protein
VFAVLFSPARQNSNKYGYKLNVRRSAMRNAWQSHGAEKRIPLPWERAVGVHATGSHRIGNAWKLNRICAKCGASRRTGSREAGSDFINASLRPTTTYINELPDDVWTKVNIEFYRDAPDAVFKALEA